VAAQNLEDVNAQDREGVIVRDREDATDHDPVDAIGPNRVDERDRDHEDATIVAAVIVIAIAIAEATGVMMRESLMIAEEAMIEKEIDGTTTEKMMIAEKKIMEAMIEKEIDGTTTEKMMIAEKKIMVHREREETKPNQQKCLRSRQQRAPQLPTETQARRTEKPACKMECQKRMAPRHGEQ